jgi:hypothetical protein
MFLNSGDTVKYMQRKCELVREQALNRESETCLRLGARKQDEPLHCVEGHGARASP